MNPKQIESLVEKISQMIPQNLGKLPESAKSNLQQTLSSTFEKMELVSRQEFDIQTAVLAKTRAKLEQLEKQVAELETHQSSEKE